MLDQVEKDLLGSNTLAYFAATSDMTKKVFIGLAPERPGPNVVNFFAL